MRFAALFAALVLACCPTASACDGGCGFGSFGYGLLYNSMQYRVPYFAAHPPVYYSYPVPRTYGYSPFAYPPHVRTPDIVGVSSGPVLLNPYVPSSLEAPKEAQTPDPQVSNTFVPLIVENPFFQPETSVASR